MIKKLAHNRPITKGDSEIFNDGKQEENTKPLLEFPWGDHKGKLIHKCNDLAYLKSLLKWIESKGAKTERNKRFFKSLNIRITELTRQENNKKLTQKEAMKYLESLGFKEYIPGHPVFKGDSRGVMYYDKNGLNMAWSYEMDERTKGGILRWLHSRDFFKDSNMR